MTTKFLCPNCGPVDSITGSYFEGDIDVALTFDENGEEVEEFYNPDFEEHDGWYCEKCGGNVDRNDTVEVD